jgi:hypothetical protein
MCHLNVKKPLAGARRGTSARDLSGSVESYRDLNPKSHGLPSVFMKNVGPALQALQPTKDAIVRAGALLIVKIDWVVQV